MLDTNVLLYAAMGSDSAPEKRKIARDIVATQAYSTSAQVLSEFYTNAIKVNKWDVPLSREDAAHWVAVLSAKPCLDIDSRVVMDGITLSMRYDISYWDAAILAAAKQLGVKTLYTEDLNHGQDYDGVIVINPFRDIDNKFQ